MRQRAIFFILAGLLSAPVHSDSLDILLGDGDARFLYATEAFGGTYGPLDLELGYLTTEDSDALIHAGLLIRKDTLDSPVIFSLGTRVYYADAGNAATLPDSGIGAISIGAEILYIPDDLGGLGFGMHIYIAPEVVSFFDATGLVEYGFRFNFEITEQTGIYLSYQNIETELDTGVDLEILDATMFGISLRF
jgi:hypothetical protein